MHDLLNDGTLSKPRDCQLQTFPQPIPQKKYSTSHRKS